VDNVGIGHYSGTRQKQGSTIGEHSVHATVRDEVVETTTVAASASRATGIVDKAALRAAAAVASGHRRHGLSASLLLTRYATRTTRSVAAILVIVIISFVPSLHVDLVGVV